MAEANCVMPLRYARVGSGVDLAWSSGVWYLAGIWPGPQVSSPGLQLSSHLFSFKVYFGYHM